MYLGESGILVDGNRTWEYEILPPEDYSDEDDYRVWKRFYMDGKKVLSSKRKFASRTAAELWAQSSCSI